MRWMGERYGERLKAWWFDSPDTLDPRGPVNTVSTDMTGYQFSWERFTEAAKAGFGRRLVAYCGGMDIDYRYTSHQDYLAGELSGLHRRTGPPPALPCSVLSAGELTCGYKTVERMHTSPSSQTVDGPAVAWLDLSR